jgi:hypothetical protein
MQNIKLLNLVLSGIIPLMLFSCSAKYRLATYFIPEKMVPADFNPKKQVLLFAEFPQKNDPYKRHVGYTNKMIKILEDLYPYKYEVVTLKEITEPNSKYADTFKYKYGVTNFMVQVRRTSSTTTVRNEMGRETRTTVSPSITQTLNRFHFFDRNSGINYPGSEMGTSNLGEGFTEFVKVILRAQENKR